MPIIMPEGKSITLTSGKFDWPGKPRQPDQLSAVPTMKDRLCPWPNAGSFLKTIAQFYRLANLTQRTFSISGEIPAVSMRSFCGFQPKRRCASDGDSVTRVSMIRRISSQLFDHGGVHFLPVRATCCCYYTEKCTDAVMVAVAQDSGVNWLAAGKSVVWPTAPPQRYPQTPGAYQSGLPAGRQSPPRWSVK